MKKTIKLVNCFGDTQEFTIDNFENVAHISIKILSQDEVTSIVYKNGKTVEFDSDTHFRCMDFYEGDYVVFPHELDKFNELSGNCWDRQREVNKWRNKW